MRKLNFTGGEPLCHPDCDSLFAEAAAAGLFVVLSTNGMLIPQHRTALRHVHQVMLSCDGDEPAHDALRGRGSHAAVLHACELLAADKIPFWLTATLTARNLDQIDYLLTLARRFHTYANFVPLNFHTGAVPDVHPPQREQLAGLLLSTVQLHGTFARLLACKRAGQPVGSSIPYLRHLLAWPDYETLTTQHPHPTFTCRAGQLYCQIYPDGSLSSCGLLVNRDPSLNVFATDFATAFRRLPRPENCRSCRSACEIENNLIYGISFSAISNWCVKLFHQSD